MIKYFLKRIFFKSIRKNALLDAQKATEKIEEEKLKETQEKLDPLKKNVIFWEKFVSY